jgi:hypothetical protein
MVKYSLEAQIFSAPDVSPIRQEIALLIQTPISAIRDLLGFSDDIDRPIFDIRDARTGIGLTAICNNGGAAWRWRIESGGRLRLPSCKGYCRGLT